MFQDNDFPNFPFGWDMFSRSLEGFLVHRNSSPRASLVDMHLERPPDVFFRKTILMHETMGIRDSYLYIIS